MDRWYCLELAEKVAYTIRDVISECDCITLSGGVDTTFIALAHPNRGSLKAVTVDLGGPDVAYAGMVASSLSLRHDVIEPGDSEILEALDWVLGNMRTIDPVEVSADIVHYITASWASSGGCTCLLSGDGGDEVFLGYGFLEDMSLEELRGWHERILESARLPTVEVGLKLGVRVIAPLYLQEIRSLAKITPLDCMIQRGVGGKILLRLYIESRGLREIAWRPKTPVNIGSGAMNVLKRIASNTTLDEGRVVKAMGFKPPSTLHAFLAYRMMELNVKPPERVEGGCPICGRGLQGRTCRFCGSYLSSRGVILHYTGD